jgi:DNA-binding NarL/FixJ family response regulator
LILLLIFDDHPLVRDGLRLRLASLPDLEIVGEASSAIEALALIAQVAPDLVLADVDMPGMSGIDLVAQLRQSMPAVQVVMLSMHGDPSYLQRALQAGARGYVLKDAPASDVLAAIQAVRAGGTYLSGALSKRLFRTRAPRPLLTPRESQVLRALGGGASSKQIARDFGLSVRTVEAHRQSIKRRLGVEGQAGLIKFAVEHTRELEVG